MKREVQVGSVPRSNCADERRRLDWSRGKWRKKGGESIGTSHEKFH